MARIRSIKPEFFRHEVLFEAEREVGLPLRVAFAGLWTACDREGRFVWSPRQLKLDCLPYDDVDFSRVLHALWTRGFIEKYAVDGKEYGFVPSWNDHQIINNRETGSRLPEPNENNILTREARVDDALTTRHGNYQGEGKGREGKGRDKGTRHDASEFENFKREYPSRGEAANPWKPAREKFERLVRDGAVSTEIIAGATAYRKSCERMGIIRSDKVAQAITWLNQERWRDSQQLALQTEQVDWDCEVARFKDGKLWPFRRLGPEPGYGGCKAPREILEKHGLEPGSSTENAPRETSSAA